MSQLVGFTFSIGGAVVMFLVVALWLWLQPRSTAGRRFLVTAAIAYTLASIYAVPVFVSRLLTHGYHQFSASDVPPGPTAVVVLGAGDETAQGWDEQRLSVLSRVGAARVLETLRVYRLIEPAWIICSGGLPDPPYLAEPSSLIMRDALVRLGVPESRILLESTSRDTHDEALLTALMLRSLQIQHLVLVTSDIHMRRSLGALRAQGWDAVPAIAPDPYRTDPWPKWVLPHQHGLSFSGDVVHETLGILYYRLRGWWQSQ